MPEEGREHEYGRPEKYRSEIPPNISPTALDPELQVMAIAGQRLGEAQSVGHPLQSPAFVEKQCHKQRAGCGDCQAELRDRASTHNASTRYLPGDR
jgi:hypothetical protein